MSFVFKILKKMLGPFNIIWLIGGTCCIIFQITAVVVAACNWCIKLQNHFKQPKVYKKNLLELVSLGLVYRNSKTIFDVLAS